VDTNISAQKRRNIQNQSIIYWCKSRILNFLSVTGLFLL